MPKEVRGNVNNLHFGQEPDVYRYRRAWLNGEVRAAVGRLRGGVRAEALKGAQWDARQFKVLHRAGTPRGMRLEFLVDKDQVGGDRNRSPSLCAWPKVTGRAIPGGREGPKQPGLSALGNFGVTCLIIHKAKFVMGFLG